MERIRRWIVHQLGGMFEDEIPNTKRRWKEIKHISVVSEFDNDVPLTDPSLQHRVKKDLCAMIAQEMMENGAIKFRGESAYPHYYLRADANVALPIEGWW